VDNKNYTTINNTIARDSRLSAKAKGIWLYAFSRPDDWSFYVKDIIKYFTDGRDSIYAGLKELEECGYLIRTQSSGKNGKFNRVQWQFFEIPQVINENDSKSTFQPQTGFPVPAKPYPENHPLLSTDIKNTEYTKGDDYTLTLVEPTQVTEKSSPSIEENKSSSKFPLKPHQQIYFDQMKELGLEEPDHVLKIIIRTSEKKGNISKLEQAISHLKAEIEKGTVFKKSRIAMFQSVINGKIPVPICDNTTENRKFILAVKKKAGWDTLDVKEKYVICELTGKEVSLNRPHKEFKESAEQLFNTWKGR
jgi:phage pi2 protein 07